MANAQLITDIQKRFAKGESEEHMRESLKKLWSAEDINSAFAVIKLQNSPMASIDKRDTFFVPSRQHSTRSVLLNLVVLVLFIGAVPVLYIFLMPTVESAFSQFTNSKSATTTTSTSNTAAQTKAIETALLSPTLWIRPAASRTVITGQGEIAQATQAQPTVSANTTNTSNVSAASSPSNPIQPTPTVSTSVTTQTPNPTDASSDVPLVPPTNPAPAPDPTPVAPVVPVNVPDPIASSTSASTTNQVPINEPPENTPPVNESPVSPAPSGTYPVYAGCTAPPTTFAHTIYIDPANGSDTGDGTATKPYKTLGTAMTKQEIIPDSHVILLAGNQGTVSEDSGHNPKLVNPSGWVWFDFQPGAYIQNITLRGLSNFLITNGTFTYPAGGRTFVAFADGNNMVVADSQFYTTQDTSAWTAATWIGADSGFDADNSSCISILRNHYTNIRGGIVMSRRAQSPDPTLNSIKALIENNVIKNHSADGMDPIGSDITIYNNGIYDDYVSIADGDGNHDDGIQGFALNGAVYSNVTIDHNWVQETTDPNRKFNAQEQGISSFNGIYENLKVTNNVVLTSAYHGIAWYGVHNALIDHNTVVDPVPGVGVGWIYTPAETGNNPSNVVVSNNTAPSIFGSTVGVTYTNNIVSKPTADFTTFDPADNDYDFTPKPGSALAGSGAGAPSDMSKPILVSITMTQKNGRLLAEVWSAIKSIISRL